MFPRKWRTRGSSHVSSLCPLPTCAAASALLADPASFGGVRGSSRGDTLEPLRSQCPKKGGPSPPEQ